jgi:hypothetical protein
MLKQGDALSPLLLNLTLEYVIKEVQDTQVGLKLNVKHQLLFYADDLNRLGDNTDVIKKTNFLPLRRSGLEVNREKTKYLLLSRRQNAEQNQDIKTANRCFENVAQFKYFGTTVKNQNLI